MVDVLSQATEGLHRTLQRFALKVTISRIAGLLIEPRFQANAVRLELLAHVAVSACSGRERPTYQDLSAWLNGRLGQTDVAAMEDDPEDVFVGNIQLPEGNRRLLNGIWEEGAFHVQYLLQVVSNPHAPPACEAISRRIRALLKISDSALNRAGLSRWEIGPSSAKGRISLDHTTDIQRRAQHASFTLKDLESLGIDPEDLNPFLFDLDSRSTLRRERLGHSALERRPVIRFGDEFVLAVPTAVSAAIRRYVVEVAMAERFIEALNTAYVNVQADVLLNDVLSEFKPSAKTVAIGLPQIIGPLQVRSWLIRPEDGRYVHALLVADSLAEIELGLDSPARLTANHTNRINEILSQVWTSVSGQADFASGESLIVIGGAGRGFLAEFEESPANWAFCAARLSDLHLLAGQSDGPISRLLISMGQRDEAVAKGVTYFNINGDINFFAALQQSDFSFASPDMPVPGSTIFLAHDYVKPLRVETRRNTDPHVLPTVDGVHARVSRFTHDSYFDSLKVRPIYVSADHLKTGEIAGAVSGPDFCIWLTTELTPQEKGGRVTYEIWSGALQLLDRLCCALAESDGLEPGPWQVHLDFNGVTFDLPVALEPGGETVEGDSYSVHLEQDRRVRLEFGRNYLRAFSKPINDGEGILVSALYKALLTMGAIGEGHSVSADEAIRLALPTSGARFLHAFEPRSVVDWLLSTSTERATLIHSSDVNIEALGLMGDLGYSAGEVLEGEHACNEAIHKAVELLYLRLRSRLRSVERQAVVRMSMLLHESIISDRLHWANTAQALLALYESTDDVLATALAREAQRNRAAVAARTLIEIGICESTSRGRPLSKVGLLRLLGLASLFIDTATDSDAIKSGFADPRLETYANGEYGMDRTYQDEVIRPFMAEYFKDAFNDAADAYGDLYETKSEQISRIDEATFEAGFSEAFQEEYGLTPEDVLKAVSECIDIATERRAAVVEIQRGELLRRINANRGLSMEICCSFLAAFGLFPREKWSVPPPGFVNKDLNPWRFRRRLSATVRPFAVLGQDETAAVIYGVGALRLGVTYLLQRSEEGQLPTTFFSSAKMKSYIGTAVDKRGHLFARGVADKLQMAGWQVRSELQMRELLAPRSEADGDIDVLAWNASGDVYILECKRLQMARTVAEIAEVCRKFRGEAKDELGKHLRRSNWIIKNPESLRRVIGFTPDTDRIFARVVTSTHVPMRYLSDLPIASTNIGPIGPLLVDMAAEKIEVV